MNRAPVSLADLLDRVLDKGIVIQYRARTSVGGIAVLGLETHVAVLSIETYFGHATGEFPSGAVIRAVEDYLRRLPGP